MSAASDRTHLVEFDAAIVGYGPVGQAPAALLGRAGHRVVAFERFQEIYRLPRGPSGPRDRGIEDPDDGTTIMEFSSPTRTTRAPCSERDVRNGERAHLPAEQACASANHTTEWPTTSATSGSTAQHRCRGIDQPLQSWLNAGLTVGVAA